MPENNYTTRHNAENPQMTFPANAKTERTGDTDLSQMSMTDMVRASSLNGEKNTPHVLESSLNKRNAPTEDIEKKNAVKSDSVSADSTLEKKAPNNADTLNNDDAAPAEDFKKEAAKSEGKTSKGRKNKKELTPAEEEKAILKRLAKNNAENAELESRLVTVRSEKSADDLKNINKICSEKGIPLSDLIDFLKHLKNSDTLKMLKSEISVRSKTIKKEAPPAGKTG